MINAISSWAVWIVSLWNGFAGNVILSIPLIMIAFSIILIMFDRIKALIK